MLFAAPALLVPAIEIPLVIWARQAYLERHPDQAAALPTISRAISDPAVGEPFAALVLLITALIALAAPVILRAYHLTILRLPLAPAARRTMQGMVVAVLLSQVAASAGMIITTQYSLTEDGGMHMLGSYLFFAFQALTILLAAVLCRTILHLRQRHAVPERHSYLLPGMHSFRFRFAVAITGLSLLYGVLFVIKDWTLPVSGHWVLMIYTQCEVLVIASFVLFLGSYAVDIYSMMRRGPMSSSLHWPVHG